jgi:hypothetical protein
MGQASGVQLDFGRITEDAAEAVALAMVHENGGWTVLRRMQRGDFADWLLLDADGREVALEVSGVDKVDTGQRRLKTKIRQVRRSPADRKAAAVVELKPPRCRMVML